MSKDAFSNEELPPLPAPGSGELASSVLESITDAFFALNREWQFSYVNKRGEEMLQPLRKTRESLLGKVLWQEFPDLAGTALENYYRRAMDQREPIEFETFYHPLNVWLLGRIFPCQTGISAFFQDITARKHAEQSLAKSSERYQTLVASIDQGFCVLELLFDEQDRPRDYRFLEVNPAFERSTGIKNATGRTIRELSPGIEEHWIDLYGQVALTGRPLRFADQAKEWGRWFEVFAFRVEHPSLRRVAVLVTDITKQKEAAQALRDSELRFRAVTEQAPFSVQILSPDGRTLRVNKSWEDLWGATLEQLADYNILQDAQLEARGVLPAIRRAFAGEAVEIPPIRYNPNDTLPTRSTNANPERWVGAFAYPIKDGEGVVREVVLVHQDYTHRIRAEQALRQSEERYRATFENAAMGIAHVAVDGRILGANDAMCALTGYSRDELLGMTFADITHPDDRESTLEATRRALEGAIRTYSLEKRYIRKDGSARWVRITSSLLRDEADQPQMFIRMVEDAHDRKTTAERLERLVQERTAALRDTVQQLETFSYSIVHDMRAPLRSMHSFAALLQEEYADGLTQTGQDYLTRIMTAASRLDALITDVLSYSRVSISEVELAPVNLDKLVIEILEQYPQFEKAAGQISVHRPLARVMGNTGLLTQVISNLLGNALKFVPSAREPRILVRTEPVPNLGRVKLWVEDNGIGIAPEHRQKIFELFSRLHAPQEYAGTGVGLAIVWKAVSRMGGRVGVESEVGRGSRFWVELARSDSP